MANRHPCESCSMPIDSGRYCEHCTDDQGNLQPFEERVERFTALTLRQHPDLDPVAARRQTIDYMATMPAWKDNPQLKAALNA